jgi:hypothetical protein
VRRDTLPRRRAARSFKHLLLPDVPEGLRRSIHGLRPIPHRAGSLGWLSRNLRQFKSRRKRFLRKLRNTVVLPANQRAVRELDDQQLGRPGKGAAGDEFFNRSPDLLVPCAGRAAEQRDGRDALARFRKLPAPRSLIAANDAADATSPGPCRECGVPSLP